MKLRLTVCLLALLATVTPRAHAQASLHSHLFAEALSRQVDAAGRINFAGFKHDPSFAAFLAAIARHDPNQFKLTLPADATADEKREAARFMHNARCAFWINAYNALALKAIAAAYDGKLKSVRQLRDFATRPIAEVAGKPRSLREIEETILRKELKEPAAPFVLYRGVVGGPLLPTAPISASDFEDETEAAMTELFTRKALIYRVDTIGRILWLPDFLAPYEKDFKDGPLGLGRFLAPFFPHEREKRVIFGADEFEVKYWPTDTRLELPAEKPTAAKPKKK